MNPDESTTWLSAQAFKCLQNDGITLAEYLISKSGINRSAMKKAHLGEFEEIVLLILAVLETHAYGVKITHEIIEQTGRKVRLNQVHAALYRLENKGMMVSKMGSPTNERGGRRKRIFAIAAYGRQTLNEMRATRLHLRDLVPDSIKITSA